jgi:3-phenylpropionate/trans-cinnamate dioxygenase ferredoxin subunit
MNDWTQVSTFSAFGDQRQLTCRVDGLPLLLLRTGATVVVLHDCCTHFGRSLYGGRVMAGHITCPFHGACFDLKTGAAVSGPAVFPVTVFPAQVVDSVIWADLTKRPAKPAAVK